MSNTEEKIEVDVKSLMQVFNESNFSLKLDSYQRPYVWSEDKVQQLLDDLNEHNNSRTDNPYYMGTLLFHCCYDKETLFVIDGQQRLTTLAIIYLMINNQQLPKKFKFNFNSKESCVNIKHTANILKDKLENFTNDLLQKICFTIITVTTEDLAFTFFDTQNNRGVPLAATDILKAYHLRGIGIGKQEQSLQKYCAARWEGIQSLDKNSDFAQILFFSYLWKIRNWRGSDIKPVVAYNDVIDSFQKQAISSDVNGKNDTVPLFPGVANQFATHIQLTKNDSFQLTLKSIGLNSDTSNLPFEIRQPVFTGVGFFLYAQKYAAMLHKLKNSEVSDSDGLHPFKTFIDKIFIEASLSGYLQNLFWGAVLMYVDKFSFYQLTRFAEALDYSLGALRLEKYYIFKEAPIKYLRDNKSGLRVTPSLDTFLFKNLRSSQIMVS